MKKYFLILGFVFSLTMLRAQVSVGLKLGEPLGLTFKGYFGESAIEAIAGRSWNQNVMVQGHYLFQKNFARSLDWYAGVGGQIQFGDLEIGPHGVIGLEFQVSQVPIAVSADLVGFLEIVEDPFFFHPQGGLSIRYIFK